MFREQAFLMREMIRPPPRVPEILGEEAVFQKRAARCHSFPQAVRVGLRLGYDGSAHH